MKRNDGLQVASMETVLLSLGSNFLLTLWQKVFVDYSYSNEDWC